VIAATAINQAYLYIGRGSAIAEMNDPRKITNNSSANHLAKLGLGVPSGSAKHQLGLWMGCSL